MKIYGVSRSTAASPDKIWGIWSDPNNWSRGNSGITSALLFGPMMGDEMAKHFAPVLDDPARTAEA
jgi:hypothetical protein